MALMEQWFEKRIGGDYRALAAEYSLSPMTSRLLANRGIKGADAVSDFFSESLEEVLSYEDLPDIEKAVSILEEKIAQKKKIRVIGDYDIDGVCASYILSAGIRRAGGEVDVRIPHRVNDGYGLNDRLVKEAAGDETDTIITCDNGIAAIDQARLAKSLGMDMIITDHHEIPFHMDGEIVAWDIPEADAVVDPKLPDSRYAFHDICGAVIAFKLILALFDRMKMDQAGVCDLLEMAAFATIGDVMPLTGENRKLVKEGLKRLSKTANPGMRALIRLQDLEDKKLTVYHAGFVLGPCINATGRLDSAENALRLLEEADEKKAEGYAHTLVVMNNERKDMTEKAVEEALQMAGSESCEADKVLVIYLPDVHESIAGIAAGKVRERTGKPTFILTKSRDLVKGSGRSIDGYDMYRGMNGVRDLLVKFGGHRLAGGLSMTEENVPKFRREINEKSGLTDDDITPKIRFDMVLPFEYVSMELGREIEKLEPFGTGNPRPLFAAAKVALSDMRVVGKNRNCLLARAKDQEGTVRSAKYFGQAQEFLDYCRERKTVDILYDIQINRYGGKENVEITIAHYR
ncbi:MAG: single-stranded-DNA-specific exonuclease RecJ [Lachnospiraceae bacterium]|nr:single-stranded-DNA-specific exonuclease RecJ [Lachnospiraceae bacterium]